MLCYKAGEGEPEEHVICAEDKGITGTKILAGEFAGEFGGAIEMPVASIGTLGNLPPGQSGEAGLGGLGHKLPTVGVDEVAEFNRRERLRVAGIEAPTIAEYNKRLPQMTVYFSVGD